MYLKVRKSHRAHERHVTIRTTILEALLFEELENPPQLRHTVRQTSSWRDHEASRRIEVSASHRLGVLWISTAHLSMSRVPMRGSTRYCRIALFNAGSLSRQLCV